MDLVIVDDHPAVRAGLRGLIDDEEGLRVAATAASAREGIEAIADVRPAVALIDLSLPDDDGLALCLRTRSLPEPPRVIIYSAQTDTLLEVLATIAGAEAVVPKSAPPEVLLDTLRGGARARLDPRALRAVGARLSPGDLAILGMLAHGVRDEEIAATLGVDAESLLSRRAAMLPRRPLAAA
jgi:DNA-binding NarL/FixJ family response regulator